jgi:hypothetical protein
LGSALASSVAAAATAMGELEDFWKIFTFIFVNDLILFDFI